MFNSNIKSIRTTFFDFVLFCTFQTGTASMAPANTEAQVGLTYEVSVKSEVSTGAEAKHSTKVSSTHPTPTKTDALTN